MNETTNNGPDNYRPEWQDRLVEERKELLDKMIKLKNMIDDGVLKLSRKEWRMLECQYEAMRNYLQVLTDRCVFYNIISAADLGISYNANRYCY